MAISIMRLSKPKESLYILIFTCNLIFYFICAELRSQRNQSIKYIPTGESLLQKSLGMNLFQEFTPILFALTGTFLIYIFKKSIGSIASVLAALIFLADSQNWLVIISSPFWDYVNFLFILNQIIITFYSSNIKSFQTKYMTFCLIFLFFALINAHLFNRYNNYLKTNFSSALLALMLIVIAVLMSFFIRMIFIRTPSAIRLFNRFSEDHKRNIELNIFLLSGINIFTAAMLGRYNTSALPIILFLISSFLLKRENLFIRLNLLLTILFLICVPIIVQALFNSQSANLNFFFISGLVAAPNLQFGRTYGELAIPANFSDIQIGGFAALYDSFINAFANNFFHFFDLVRLHFIEGYKYIFSSWLTNVFSIPNVENEKLSSYRAVYPILSFFSIILIILSRSILRSIQLMCVIFFGIALLGLSRIEKHQWWYLTFLGFWFAAKSILVIKNMLISKSFLSYGIRTQTNKILVLSTFLILLLIIDSTLKSTQHSKISRFAYAINSTDWIPISNISVGNGNYENKTIRLEKPISGLKFQLNKQCRSAEIRLELLKQRKVISRYNIKIGNNDFFYIPTPHNWYESMRVEQFSIEKGCSLIIKSSEKTQKLIYAFYFREKGESQILDEVSNRRIELLKTRLEFTDIPEQDGNYKAYSTQFLDEHISRNSITQLIGTTLEGYKVSNIGVISLPDLPTGKIQIEGQVNSGILVIALADKNSHYSSFEIIASGSSGTIFNSCLDFFEGNRVTISRINNQYEDKKFDANIYSMNFDGNTCGNSVVKPKYGFQFTLD